MTAPLPRRRFLALIGAPIVAGVLHSCGGSNDSPSSTETPEAPVNSSSNTGTNGVARSSSGREAVCICDSSVATEVVNAFAADLLVQLNGAGTGSGAVGGSAPNIVFSPTSIAIALSMTRAGALADTAAQIDSVLHVTETALLPHSMNALQLGLADRNQTVDVPGGDTAELVLSVTNSLWAQVGFAFRNEFLDVLAAQYGAGVQLVDYRDDPDAARRLINTWVADQTDDRIPELLAPDTIGADARLTLVNAILMQAPWLKPFTVERTTALPFTLADGTVVETATMRQTERFGYADGEGWRALELPYAGSLLSMIIVLDEPGQAFGATQIAALADTTTLQRVAVSLPTFEIDTSIDLASVLDAMGMHDAFDPELADFSAIAEPDPADPEPLFIGAVVHQATITVDEAGTEAAAATAVAMAAGSAANPADPIEFTVDRPFTFAIRDNPTGAILFLGRIGDPTRRS